MFTYSYLLQNIFNPDTTPGEVFYAIVAILIAWLIGRALGLAIRRYLSRAQAAGVDSTSVRFLGQLSKGFVYIIVFILYARLVPSLQSLGATWLASVGIVSVVIGLATQSTLSNLIAGVSLIIYRPFRIGDRIQVTTPAGPEIGTVESIDLGYTRLRAPDGRRIVLPNSIITNQTNINFSRNYSRVLLEITLVIQDGSNIETAREILTNIAKTIPKITKINGCFVNNLSSQGITIMLSVMCLDPGDIAGIRSDLFENAKKQFDSAGIKLA